MTKTQNIFADLFMGFWNDYLTLEKFAEHNQITLTEARFIYRTGRKYHDQRAQEFKEARITKELNKERHK